MFKFYFASLVFFVCLPLGFLALYLLNWSEHERYLFKAEPNLLEKEAQHGLFYSIKGSPKNYQCVVPLLNINTCFSYVVEKQVFQNGQWNLDLKTPVSRFKVSDFKIDKYLIVVKKQSRDFLSINTAFVEVDDRSRYRVRYKLFPTQLAVWGAFQHKTLSDGLLQRMVIYEPFKKMQVTEKLTEESVRKNQLLYIAAWVLLGLSFMAGVVFLSAVLKH